MQKSIKILRVALPIAFVSFLVLIGLSWKRSRTVRDGGAIEPVVVSRPERPRVESKEFEDTQTVGGRVVAHIRARRVVSYSSNWNTLEGVEMTIFRPSGSSYKLSCPSAQFNSQTKESDAKGGVIVTSSDGVDIRTAEIHFDGNRLTNHIPVRFVIDRWHGKAGALDLSVQDETLRLFETVDAVMTPAHPGEDPMTLRGREGLFRRSQNDVTFTDQVVLTRLRDVLRSDRTVARFTPDRKSVIALEGTGHVDIVLAKGSSLNTGSLEGRKEITCDRFFSEVAPDGVINAINAVSDAALVHAVIDGPPRRELVSKTMRVALTNKVVTELKAEWQVVMKESGETWRELSGDHVVVFFDGATHRATTSVVEGNFHYKDRRNDAVAIRASYDIGGDRVLLSAEPGFDPTVTTDGNILKAKEIEFSPRAGTARATGQVIAQLVPRQNGTTTADGTTVFPASRPVFVNSDQVTMRQASRIAVFTGNVRAWQETNTLFAQELQVQGTGEQISARGDVRTVLYNTSTSPTASKAPILTNSDQLFARKAERRIDLAGNVRVDDGQRNMTSEKAGFFFDSSRRIERIESETKLVLVDRSTSRRGTGDKAIYLVPRRMIYVTGSPAVMTAPTGNLTGEQIAFDLARNKVEVLSTTSDIKGTYKP